jgi:quinol monooxygenase YgiN
MYIRTINVRIQSDKIDEFRKIYDEQIVPAVKKQKGNIDIFLMESLEREGEVISFTSWESQEDGDAYERGGTYVQMFNKVKHTFAGTPTLWSYEVRR